MRHRTITVCLVICALIGSVASCSRQCCDESAQAFPKLGGPYLGQEPPGADPQLFAPGIVTGGMATRDFTISPDGNEIFFGAYIGQYAFSTILTSRLVDGHWTKPEVAPFATDPGFTNLEAQISPDGQRLFFFSERPGPNASEGGNQDIWVMDREEDAWGEPYNLGPPISTEASEFFPSVTNDGTLYFSRNEQGSQASFIYRSRLVDGEYTEPERLPEQVNAAPAQFNAFVAADESYLIVPMFGREDSLGGTDYYICFRSEDDTWSEPINMGPKVNSEDRLEYSPYVTPDGKYFFFMTARSAEGEDAQPEALTADWLRQSQASGRVGMPAIWWMDASFIEELRP